MHFIPTDTDNLHINATHPSFYNDQLCTCLMVRKAWATKLQTPPPCLLFCSGVLMREQSSPGIYTLHIAEILICWVTHAHRDVSYSSSPTTSRLTGVLLAVLGVLQYFLRERYESKVIDICWIKGLENNADVFTKKLHGPAFEKIIKTLVGQDVYEKFAYLWARRRVSGGIPVLRRVSRILIEGGLAACKPITVLWGHWRAIIHLRESGADGIPLLSAVFRMVRALMKHAKISARDQRWQHRHHHWTIHSDTRDTNCTHRYTFA